MAVRCVNIDWFEVYVLEPTSEPRDDYYFSSRGFEVVVREYGTPMYRQMFTINGTDGRPMYEIRRDPYSEIFAPGSCHIRLSNRECYRPNSVGLLRDFLAAHGYEFRGISRFDLCADFNRFDNGHDPGDFLRRYLAGYYHKIGLSRVKLYGHDFDGGGHVVRVGKRVIKNATVEHLGHQVSVFGRDKMRQLVFNSARWGSPSSQVSCRLYDKTLELHENKDKFYIRDAWTAARIDQSKPIWRLEFQVNSSAKNWVWDETGKVYHLSLDTFTDPESLLFLWSALAAKYFVFSRREMTREGNEQRKDRAERYMPFNIAKSSPFYPVNLTADKEPKAQLVRLIDGLVKFSLDNNHPTTERFKAKELIEYCQHFRLMPKDYLLSFDERLKRIAEADEPF